MSWIPGAQTSDVFSAFSQNQAQRDVIASYALSRGAKKLQAGDVEAAIVEFKRAAAMSSDARTAHTYMGRAYTLLGQTQDAIKTFKKVVQADPGSIDAHQDLGNAYVADQQYVEAEKVFREMTKLDPMSTAAHTSLGYVALLTGRYEEAEADFRKAARLAPADPDVHYNLGLALNKQSKHGEAVTQFERAIALDRAYADAYSELGQAYIGLGQTDQAEILVGQLVSMGTPRATALGLELKAALLTPMIQYADTGDSTFSPYLGSGAPLSILDPSLATPGAAKTFSLVFHFNQAMDLASVQNIMNWSITQAAGGAGGFYDNGVRLNYERAVTIAPLPVAVVYDPQGNDATVYFSIRQNESGDGVIDPSHWVFRFFGTDVNGNPMDPRGDQWDGFAGRPF